MALTPTEACLESKCERVARIMTRQYGVTVRIAGGMAYIDMKTNVITLPNLTDDSMAYLRDVLDGFLDHECGHAIFSEYEDMKDLKSKALHNVWNAIEDVWVNGAMGRKYVGCGQNIDSLVTDSFKDVKDNIDKMDLLNLLLFRMSQIWYGMETFEDLEKEPKVGRLLTFLQPEVEEGHTVRTTKDAVALAKRILEKLEDEEEIEKAKAAMEAQIGIGEGQLSEEEVKEAIAQLEALLEEIQKLLTSDEVQKLATDIEEQINRSIYDIPDKSTRRDPEEYLVFSEEYDVDTTYTHEQRVEHTTLYSDLRREVQEYIGNMATVLELALTADTESRWVGGARRGRRWDKKKMGQWFLGGSDDRVWNQKEEGQSWDTAVSLLWDCSGSMGTNTMKGEKSYLARLAALAFHEALCRSRIAHEVLGFNTGGGYSDGLNAVVKAAEGRGENMEKYSRTDSLDNRMVFVPFGTEDGRAICEIDGQAANRDGECVLWAAKRLAQRPEKRKILIVGSDGQPQGAKYNYTEKKYLQTVVRQVINSGIELQAIGIMDESVKSYYPEWVVIRKATDIPAVVIHELAKKLFKKGSGHVRFPQSITRKVESSGISSSH